MGTPVVTPTPEPAKVEFTPEQQEHINGLFNQRFAKITSKHDSEMKAMSEKIEELKAAAEAAKPAPAPVTATAAEKEEEMKRQTKAFLDQERQNTQNALKQVEKERAEKTAVLAENKRILKDKAITDAITSMPNGLEFHDLNTVKKLVEDDIYLDEDSGQWAIKENGQPKLNAAMTTMTLAEFFPIWATTKPWLVKGVAKAGTGSAESGRAFSNTPGTIKSRADLKNTKDKVAYIATYGFPAWEKLPVR